MAAKRDIHHIIRIEVLVDSVKEKLEKLQVQSRQQIGCTINKVNPDIRKHPDSFVFDPKHVSIGPLHGQKETLKANQDLKLRYLKDLLNRNRQNTVDKYLDATRQKVSDAIKCYPELEFDELSQPILEDFVMMLVIDGCFIIELFLKYALKACGLQETGIDYNLVCWRRDLLLLENQIPYFILETLFANSVIPSLKSDFSLTELALNYLKQGKKCKIMKLPEETVIHHLLHLYHMSTDPSRAPEKPKISRKFFSKVGDIVSAFFHLFYLHTCSWLATSDEEENRRLPRVIPPATYLDENGVTFKKREDDGCFQITFEHGKLKIPYLPLTEAVMSKLRNLVAFEEHFPESGTHITKFAVWLENIIETSGDVAILRSKGILENDLAKNKDAADFINSLCRGIRLDYGKHYPAEQFKEVLEYVASDRHRWYAGLKRDYFSNPWSIISLIAAFVLLVLTVIQTIYTVCSYYQQLSSSNNGGG